MIERLSRMWMTLWPKASFRPTLVIIDADDGYTYLGIEASDGSMWRVQVEPYPKDTDEKVWTDKAEEYLRSRMGCPGQSKAG